MLNSFECSRWGSLISLSSQCISTERLGLDWLLLHLLLSGDIWSSSTSCLLSYTEQNANM